MSAGAEKAEFRGMNIEHSWAYQRILRMRGRQVRANGPFCNARENADHPAAKQAGSKHLAYLVTPRRHGFLE